MVYYNLGLARTIICRCRMSGNFRILNFFYIWLRILLFLKEFFFKAVLNFFILFYLFGRIVETLTIGGHRKESDTSYLEWSWSKIDRGFVTFWPYLSLGLIQCAILRLPCSSSCRQHPYEHFFISEKELGPEVTLFSYNWPVCDVAIFEVT